MTVFRQLFWVIWLLGMDGQVCQAQVSEAIRYKYYQAKLLENQTLLESLTKASPIREGGEPFLGYAKSDFAWRYKWRRVSGGRCAIETHSTYVTTEITLPVLITNLSSVKQRFDVFKLNLANHEKHHARIAKGYAVKIDQAIRMLPSKPNCDELTRQIDATANRLVTEFKHDNKAYDAHTQHGRTEGAWLVNE